MKCPAAAVHAARTALATMALIAQCLHRTSVPITASAAAPEFPDQGHCLLDTATGVLDHHIPTTDATTAKGGQQ